LGLSYCRFPAIAVVEGIVAQSLSTIDFFDFSKRDIIFQFLS
jgi:hypothetical protein